MLSILFLMTMAVVMTMFFFVVARPPAQRALVRGRHNLTGVPVASDQVRKLLAARAATSDREKTLLNRFLPDTHEILTRIEAAGKKWTVKQYYIGSGIAAVVPFLGLMIVGLV